MEETDCEDELTDEMKIILDERLMEDESTDMSGEDFLSELREKYGIKYCINKACAWGN